MLSWFRHAHPVCFSLSVHWCFITGSLQPRLSSVILIHDLSLLVLPSSYQVFGSPKPSTRRCFERSLSHIGTVTSSLVLPCSLSFWAIRSRLTLSPSSSSFYHLFLSALTHLCASSRGNTDRSNLSPSHSVSSVRRSSFFHSRSLDETGILRPVIKSL